jgi:signal transduction histidine kinase
VQVTLDALPSAGGGFAPVLAEIVDVTAVKDAEHAKTAFLAGLSHELKTPLSVIRGFAETLGYETVRADDKMWREGIEVILSETDHLTRIVDRLLTAARLQAGALGLDLDEVDVARLLADQIESFRRVHPDREWEMSLDTEATVRGDADQLREVFGNLLSNAVKFSRAGTKVSAHVVATLDDVRVAISDEGPGVPAADRDHVFERFFRGSTDREGTGLGLYMSRAIAQAHGGQLTLDETLGSGATFVVVLPRSGPGRADRPSE